MKSLHVILEEIKAKHPEVYERIENNIHEIAKEHGIDTKTNLPPKDGEHPQDPPIHP